jgi:hypothetical protein
MMEQTGRNKLQELVERRNIELAGDGREYIHSASSL